MEYEKMLDEAYAQLPTDILRHKRFDVPKPEVTVQGPKTVLHNFKDICDVLNRNHLHVLRFLSKEVATAGTVEGSRAIFHGRFDGETFRRLIERYINEFIMCPVCRRPDTKISKEKRLYFLICEACGARSPIRPI